MLRSSGVYWFDKEKGYERELKYCENQRTPFVDEMKGDQRLAHIIFRNGSLYVEKEKTVLQKLLSLYHPHKDKIYTTTLQIDLPHKPGMLGEISTLIGLNKGNIVNVELISKSEDYLIFSFDLQIKDLKNFTNLISQIKQKNLNFKIIRHKNKKNAFLRRIFENFKRN